MIFARRKFSQFRHLLAWANLYISHDDYTEDTVIYTALAQIYSSEYFCNARVMIKSITVDSWPLLSWNWRNFLSSDNFRLHGLVTTWMIYHAATRNNLHKNLQFASNRGKFCGFTIMVNKLWSLFQGKINVTVSIIRLKLKSTLSLSCPLSHLSHEL